ncbi:AfsR/SARP family transcriptional regulator [Actinospica sp.]|uniref:AfsR/SARP family transcriptional regulator n=1 Tax=Actinospica sp. TaxID=1872142 RepID=UPI002C90F9E5|nr:BTAD domain-containing putative transcriptional regulator [Actinospica sp.]HWG23148.1 BTAD domain-containing putative transcriptional regulator [Actinospica sp.]
MGSIRFSLLGALRVTTTADTNGTADATEIEIRGKVRQTLLAALLLQAGTVVSLDRLVDLLWTVERDHRSDARIYNQITRLRQALPGAGDRVRAVPPGYLIEVEPGELDLHVFADHNAAARAAAANGDWGTASRHYSAALKLWRGAPLADIPALAGLPEVLRLDEERWAAVLGRGEAELNLGKHVELIPELRGLAKAEPEREPLHRQLMLALYRSGRRGEALDVYRALSRTLDERFALEPGAETRELHERILRDDSARNQLPADTRLFTGRESEVDRLLALAKTAAEQDGIRSPGAVSISAVDGLGGVGKSALAVHVAHQLGGLFPDGRLFIDLRGHTRDLEPLDPHAALGYLLRSLDLSEQHIAADAAGRAVQLQERLTGTRTLVVLDNAESAEQVRPLLPEVPGCMALITSRARLADLRGAYAFRLDVLPVAAARDLLYVAAGKNRIQTDDPALDDLVELCGRIPLALRIIAARLRHDPSLSVASLAALLRAEGGRLRNLRDDERGLTDIFESSYAALSETCRRALRLLGLMPGIEFGAHAAAAAFDLEPAETAEVLGSLVAHSLLMEPNPGRYRFHDLMRLYARELAERDESGPTRHEAMERLLYWFAATTRDAATVAHPIWQGQELPPRVGSASPLLMTEVQQALDWYDLERENLLAAVSAAEREGLPTYGWLLPVVMWPFTELRGIAGDRLVLAEIGLRCAEAVQDTAGRNLMLRCKSTALAEAGRFDDAIDAGQLSLKYARQDGDQLEEARLLSNLNTSYHRAQRFDEALDHGQQALRLFEALGREDLGVVPRINVAASLNSSGRAADAVPILRKAVDLSRQSAARVYLGSTLVQLAGTLNRLDPPDNVGAEALCRESLTEFVSSGNLHGEAQALAQIGMSCLATGRSAEALDHLRASKRIADELGIPLFHTYRDTLEQLEKDAAAGSAP